MLVRSLLANVLLNAAAASTIRSTGIQNVNDHIGGIDDLVKLVPNTLALTLAEDRISGGSERDLYS